MLLVLGMLVWSFRAFPKKHPVRGAMVASSVFILISAAIGALLVLASYVTFDRSVGRAVTMPLHLMNTFMLLGSLTLAALWAGGQSPIRWRGQGPVMVALVVAVAGMFVLGATGAISAMGKTAFANELAQLDGFWDSLRAHTAADAHPILRGGLWHPLLATTIGAVMVWVCGLVNHLRPDPAVRRWSRWTLWTYAVQYVLGVVNVLVMAPLAMQIVHLALALAGWLALVLLASHALSLRLAPAMTEPQPISVQPAGPRPGLAQLCKDYVALTKPRVISLLLFVAVASMFIAANGWPGGGLIVAVLLGGYMSAGAANAINMVLEPDLDLAMGRTANRPTVGGRITRRNALVFAAVLAFGSFAILSLLANVLSAVLAWSGLLFYVLIYTMWLKRRTWQNIVIGGAAGAFPPLVGYAAVTNNLNPFAWVLFGIIFAWTPVHFWALALLLKEDYARAGVPMLPVVRGERVTVIQIAIYAVLTALISAAPLLQREVGMLYFVGAGLLNVLLIVQSIQLVRRTERPQALALFKYSMVYLALLFMLLAFDRSGFLS